MIPPLKFLLNPFRSMKSDLDPPSNAEDTPARRKLAQAESEYADVVKEFQQIRNRKKKRS